MSEFTSIIPKDQVPEGAIRQIEHGDAKVAVANIGGTIYAIQDRCPHRMANLSDGRLEGDTVVCPKHKGQFDLKTGEPRVWVAEPRVLHLAAKLVPPSHRCARVYDARIEGDDIVIGG